MRKFFTRLPRDMILFGAVPIALLAGTWLVAKATVDHLLYHDAVATGRNWTAYIADNVKDLAEIAKGAKPNADSQSFFERAREAGQVFRFVIYDPGGHARFVSDSFDKDKDEDSVEAKDEDDDLAEHNPAAARASAEGRPLVNAEDGEPPARPAFFSEAYLPAVQNGKTIAIVETYVDQAEKRDEYRRTLILMSAALLVLIALAFGAPALAWLKRSNEKRLAEAHIQFLAHHDALTGLINRNRLVEEAAAALAGLAKSKNRIGLHHIAVDHFKDVNDTLGHDAGDALIMAVAGRLKALAGDNDRVARIGGDEFVVLQVGAPDEKAICAFAAEARCQLSLPYDLNGQAGNVTVSIGVAVAPDHGDTVARLMKSADLALYRSKTGSRGAISIFAADMDDELAERLRLERAIRDALTREAFELYYQPSVEMPA